MPPASSRREAADDFTLGQMKGHLDSLTDQIGVLFKKQDAMLTRLGDHQNYDESAHAELKALVLATGNEVKENTRQAESRLQFRIRELENKMKATNDALTLAQKKLEEETAGWGKVLVRVGIVILMLMQGDNFTGEHGRSLFISALKKLFS